MKSAPFSRRDSLPKRKEHELFGPAKPSARFFKWLGYGIRIFLGIKHRCRALRQRVSRIKGTHCFFASPANALCTSDREIPNSRAIRAGVTPALNAARTAFSFP